MVTINYHLIREFSRLRLEEVLLILSGLQTKAEVNNYTDKLRSLEEGFQEWLKDEEKSPIPLSKWGAHQKSFGFSEDYITAGNLFGYLSGSNKSRYKLYAYRFNRVIDAQIDHGSVSGPVGNCLGLTALYNILGSRLGLDLSIKQGNNHLFSLLHADGKEVEIENTAFMGFNERKDDEKYFTNPTSTLIISYQKSIHFTAKKEGGLYLDYIESGFRYFLDVWNEKSTRGIKSVLKRIENEK